VAKIIAVIEIFTKDALVMLKTSSQIINQCNKILKYNINNCKILVPCTAEKPSLFIKVIHIN
jgi:hypothetical protein